MVNKKNFNVWVVSQSARFFDKIQYCVLQAFPEFKVKVLSHVNREIETLKEGVVFDLIVFDLYPAGSSVERNIEILARLPEGLRKRVIISSRNNLDIYPTFKDLDSLNDLDFEKNFAVVRKAMTAE